MIKIEELHPGLLVQENSSTARALYQVVGVKDHTITLQWVYSIERGEKTGYFPTRTVTYSFTVDDAVGLVPASANLVNTWTRHSQAQKVD